MPTVRRTFVQDALVLMKFVHIDEEEHSIEFQYEIILEWADNRVTFHNLKKAPKD